MANFLQQIIFFFFFTIITSLSLISSAIVNPLTSPPTITTTSPSTTTTLTSSQFLTAITHTLSNLNFHDLAIATYSLSLSSDTHLQWLLNRPITIFAPFDSSLHTCPLCSLPLILQERSVPGLYPFNYLTHLPFGTKIETILPGRCVAVASAVNSSRIFINGAEITHPDLFISDYVIIHGVQGVISHLSLYSCVFEKVTSLNHLHSSATASLTRLMLSDVMIRLRTSGYNILSLAIRVKHSELVKLSSMTIFAVNDSTIFQGGHSYIHSVRYHVIPNQLLKFAYLERLPVSTVLPTLETGDTLMITTSGGGGGAGKNAMRINYVKIRNPDLIWNSRIVIHGLPSPFPHIRQSVRFASGRSGFSPISPTGAFGSDARESMAGPVYHTENNAPPPVVIDDAGVHQGL